jgi:hypothetical protein
MEVFGKSNSALRLCTVPVGFLGYRMSLVGCFCGDIRDGEDLGANTGHWQRRKRV